MCTAGWGHHVAGQATADEGEDGECLPMLSGEAAQGVFDGDYDG